MSEASGRLSVDLDATGLKTGADQARASLKGLGDEAKATGASVDFATQRLEDQIAVQERTAAAIRRTNPLLSESEVATRVMGTAFHTSRVSMEELIEAEKAYANATATATKATMEHAAAHVEVEAATGKSIAGLGRVGYSLTSFVDRMAGVNPAVGRLVDVLGNFAIGSGFMTAIVGGIALAVVAYQHLTGAAAEAAKAIQDVIDKLDAESKKRHETALYDKEQVQAKIDALKEQISLAQTFANSTPSLSERASQIAGDIASLGHLTGPGIDPRAAALDVVIAKTKELNELKATAFQADLNVSTAEATAHATKVANLITLLNLHKATAADEAERRQFIAQDRALADAAGASQDVRAAKEKEIADLLKAGTKEGIRAANDLAKAREAEGKEADHLLDTLRKMDDAATLTKSELRQKVAQDMIEQFSLLSSNIQDAAGGLTAFTAKVHQMVADQESHDWMRKTIDLILKEEEGLKKLTDRMAEYNAKQLDKGVPFPKGEAAFMGLPGPKDYAQALKAYDEHNKAIADHSLQMHREINRVFETDLEHLLAGGLKSWDAFFQSVIKAAKDASRIIADDIAFNKKNGLSTSDLEKAGGGALAGLGIGLGTKDPLAGLLGGGVSGFEIGGPLGAAAGALTGFIGGILGAGAAAAKAAEQMRLATETFTADLQKLMDVANPRGALGTALEGLTNQFVKLVEEAAKASGVTLGGSAKDYGNDTVASLQAHLAAIPADTGVAALDDANKKLRTFWEDLLKSKEALDAANKAIEEQTLLQRRYATEDLNVRLLRAHGDTAAADAQAFANTQQREWQAALDKYAQSATPAETAANGLYLTNLQITQAAEREALILAQAAAAIDKHNQELSKGLSLDAQLANAHAGTPGLSTAQADAYKQQALWNTLQQGLIDIGTQFQKGALTGSEAQKSLDLVWLNYRNGMLAIQIATDAATKALADYNTATTAAANQSGQQSGISIAGANAAKGVLASGGTMDAALKAADKASAAAQIQYDTMVRNAAHQKALDDAMKAGANATTLAAIKNANTLDDMAVAAKEYLATLKQQNDAAKVNAALLAAENASKEDLRVRMLRAEGQGAAADALQLQINNDRELQKYKDQGFSAAFIKYAQSVFAMEEGKLASDQAKAAQQTVASASAAGASHGSLSFANVQTITQAQGDMLTSYAAGQLATLNRIEQLLGGHPVGIGVTGANGAAYGVASIDTGLAHQANVNSSANGTTVPV